MIQALAKTGSVRRNHCKGHVLTTSFACLAYFALKSRDHIFILFQCVTKKREEETNKEVNQQTDIKFGVDMF